jgi:hypothetical protein
MFKKIFLLCTLLILIGCAPEIKKIPSTLVPMASGKNTESFYLTKDVIINLPTGYKRILKHKSRWLFIGKIPQGSVYKPLDQVLTIEGAHIHEAYLVISNRQLVGFYLPVENAFSPILSKPLLPIEPIK